MKKVIIIISSLFLLFSFNLYAYDFCLDGMYYTIIGNEQKEVEVSAFSSNKIDNQRAYTGEIEIPEHLTVGPFEFIVSRIGDDAFNQCVGLTKVSIPKSVSSIGQCAFSGCSGLEEIILPVEVKNIDPKAFEGCVRLSKIELPPYGVSVIGSCAFRGCTSLRELNIPYGVTLIDSYAFADCANLQSLEIANSVTKIGDGAFSSCYGLRDFYVPGGVTEIGALAFEYCYGLNSVTVPENVSQLGDGAFRGCYGLKQIVISAENQNYIEVKGLILNHDKTELLFTSVNYYDEYVIPNTVVSIHDYAFMGCSRLSSITIPKSVRRIGKEAFLDCSPLVTIEIPNTLADIGERAFEGTLWKKLQPEGVLYAGSVAYEFKGEIVPGGIVLIKDGIVGIADAAFCNQKNLAGVALPAKLTHIGFGAFRGSGLASIDLPKNVETIGDRAFCECTALKEIHFRGSEVPKVGPKTFLQVNTEQCTLFVPSKSVTLFAESSDWNIFKNVKAEK